jgi:Holliday junction resolvase-like predicted endonuclease
MKIWQDKEKQARRAIEDRGFVVHDANVIFRANCPNIDLIVYGKTRAVYVQVKSSTTPATKDGVVIHGSPWTRAQLYDGAPLYNQHQNPEDYDASLVVIVDQQKSGARNFYIAPPKALEDLVRPRGIDFADRPKRDGTRRSINFRKELPREALAPWLEAWHLFN